MCLLGSGVVFWSPFVSVRCLGSGELLMSADRVRHGINKKKELSLLYSHTQTDMCIQKYPC